MKIIEINENWITQITKLFREHGQIYEQEAKVVLKNKWIENDIVDRDVTILLALNEKDNAPLGFIQIYPAISPRSGDKYFILNNLYTVSHFRRKGVATGLLEKAKEFSYKNKGVGLSIHKTEDIYQVKRLLEKLGWHFDQTSDTYFWKTNYNPLVETKFINKQIGFGVFAKVDIEKDDKILTGKSVYKTLMRDHKTLQINKTEHSRLDVPFENTNHSCEPNAGVRENQYDGYDLVALRAIRKNEQVTMDYCMTEWTSLLGNCTCGSVNCRKNITGAKDVPLEILSGYNGYIAKYIKEKLFIGIHCGKAKL